MTEYVTLTLKEFDAIRQEIASSESQSGCMDLEAVKDVEKAVKAVKSAEKRNKIDPLFNY